MDKFAICCVGACFTINWLGNYAERYKVLTDIFLRL
jgi:hypothetical protein